MSLSDLVQLLLSTAAKFCHAIVPANQDFPCPAWKIAIGSLTTSALATSVLATSVLVTSVLVTSVQYVSFKSLQS